MGIEAPIPISAKLGDLNNVFRRIVSAAEHPHLSIPETEAGRSRKQYHRLINRSLMFVSGMPVFAIWNCWFYVSCLFIFWSLIQARWIYMEFAFIFHVMVLLLYWLKICFILVYVCLLFLMHHLIIVTISLSLIALLSFQFLFVSS